MKLDYCGKCRHWQGGNRPAYCPTGKCYAEPTDINKCFAAKPRLVQTALQFD